MATLLTPEETARGARFVRAVDRDAFVLTRALVRTTLSRYGSTAPADWRFVTNRVRVSVPRRRPGRGAALAVQRLAHRRARRSGRRLAVRASASTSRAWRDRVLEAVPERHFAPDEVRALRALPVAHQPRVFFDYWTLKEAYIKARGMGLALPLDGFAFTLHDGAPPTIRFADGFDDLDGRWQFRQAWPTPTHRLALAVESPAADVRMTLRHLPVAAVVP